MYLVQHTNVIASLFQHAGYNFIDMLQIPLVAFRNVNICYFPGLYIFLRL